MNKLQDSDIAASDLGWLENDTPVSVRFDDSYYSRMDGREETRHVFLGGNGLPEKWMPCHDFHIGELGFGTGLNFLETLHQWNKSAPEDAMMYFTSFEQYPIAQADILRALERWPDLLPLADPLLLHWPPKGEAVIDLGNVKLCLFIGDARETITLMNSEMDCWYLDGFNPAKNPELWDLDLLKRVFECTKVGGTFSTYTSAGWVKRNLQEAGFLVEKVPGFKYKRERLQGYKPVT